MIQDGNIENRWTRSDLTVRPNPVLYLDTVHTTEFAKNYKRQTFEALRIGPGDQVLDVGCGTGEDVLALAEIVGMQGRATGIDKNPAMLIEGTKRSKNTQLPVFFHHGDACSLEFPDNSFDGCRSDRAVQHMEDPFKVISEMMRVVRPGKRVVISEPDWATMVMDGAELSTTKLIVEYICERGVRHALIGRQLYALFKKAGLQQVEVRGDTFIICNFELADRIWGLSRHASQAREAGAITNAEMENWLSQLRSASQHGHFFSATVGFMVSGIKRSATVGAVQVNELIPSP
jgi:SAM-dependent methyltransferase